MVYGQTFKKWETQIFILICDIKTARCDRLRYNDIKQMLGFSSRARCGGCVNPCIWDTLDYYGGTCSFHPGHTTSIHISVYPSSLSSLPPLSLSLSSLTFFPYLSSSLSLSSLSLRWQQLHWGFSYSHVCSFKPFLYFFVSLENWRLHEMFFHFKAQGPPVSRFLFCWASVSLSVNRPAWLSHFTFSTHKRSRMFIWGQGFSKQLTFWIWAWKRPL